MPDSPQTLEGWVSIRACLVSGSREVFEILLQRGKGSRLAALEKRAKEKRVPLRYVSEDELVRYTSGSTHGGAVALVGPRRFKDLEDLGRGPQAAFLAMLDGVEDPYNFGQAVRALHAAGAHGLVVRERNWTTAAATVARASAGASEFLPMAVAASDEELVKLMQARDIRILCTDLGDETVSLYKADLTVPLLVVVGGEKRGVGRTLLDNADLVVQIPYGRNFKQALGTTPAASVIAFEVLRQRRYR